MNEIDWSQAPEWAKTVVRSGGSDGWLYWAEAFGTVSRRKRVNATGRGDEDTVVADMTKENSVWTLVEIRPTPSWSGKGLPPVGTVLEAIDKEINGGTWSKMVVLAVGKHGQDDCLIVAEVIEGQSRPGTMVASLYTGWERSFRPIRTPEKIAADERESAIGEMVQAIYLARCSLDCTPLSPANEAKCASAALYDAGYRKP